MSKQKLTSFLRPVSLILIFLVFSSLLFLTLVKAQFVGPTGSAGSAPGAIGVDASKNLSVGTSTTKTNTKFLVVSSSTDSSNFGLQILQSNQNPAFVVRNDGGVGIGTSTPNSATLTVNGTIYSSGNYTGTINAPNVSAGVFGAGNFAFPSSLGIATSSQVGLPQSLSVYGGGYFSGNVGIGTTGPGAPLTVVSNAAVSTPTSIIQNINATGFASLQIDRSSVYRFAATRYSTAGTDDWYTGTLYNGGGVNSAFSISPDNSLNSSKLVITTTGNVGIGLTSPGQKLEVAGNVSSTAVCLSGTCNTSWPVSSGGGSVSTSSAITAGYFPYWANATGGLNGTSTLYINGGGNVGIGTTNPTLGELHISGNSNAGSAPNRPRIALEDLAGSGQWIIQPWVNAGDGNLQFLRVAGSGNVIIPAGNVGIATTTPQALLSVGNTTSSLVAIFGGGTGKITVGTVDPVYTIGGTNYATYSPETTGVKVETTGVAELRAQNYAEQTQNNAKVYEYVMDFSKAPRGSDLWLFGKATNLKNNFDKLTVLLTPSFDGRVWYEKDAAKNILTIYALASAALSPASYDVSYRLTAPRFDAAEWPNTNGDSSAGFIIDEK